MPSGTTIAQRLQAARVHRDLVIHQRAEHVQHRGARDGDWRVEVVRLLCAGAGEVDASRLAPRCRCGWRRARGRRCPSHIRSRHRAAHRSRGARLLRHCPARAACTPARPAARSARPSQRARPRPSGTQRPVRAGRRDSARRCAPGTCHRQAVRAAPLRGRHRSATSCDVVEQHALLVDVRRVRRHRARRDATDVRVVAARCDEEVGQRSRSAPRLGCVRSLNTGITTVTSGKCVPPAYGAFSTYTSPGRIVSPRRRMISCTDSPIEPRCTGMCGAFAISWPCVVEQRAGKIEPLLDVHRRRRVRERHAHLLGDGHEQVVEDFEQHRIGAACRWRWLRCSGWTRRRIR